MKMQVLKKLRKLAINILATTALSVLLMCIVGLIQGYKLLGVIIPLEILLVNSLMHIGFFVLDKIHFKYTIIKYAIMLVYVVGLIIGFGFLFNWFDVIAIWVISIVGVLVVIIAIAIDALKLKYDADEINERLNKIKQRESEE